MDNLDAALAAARPAMAASFEAMVRRSFEAMVAMHGPALNGVQNCWTYARTFRGLVGPYAVKAKESALGKRDGAYSLDADRLAAGAAAYAQQVTDAAREKIEEKLATLQDAEVTHLNGGDFTLHGLRDGRRVRIEQQVILNVSSKGTPFHQFPARIHLDGKAISAAAYKKAFA